jgi:hypothetical protein
VTVNRQPSAAVDANGDGGDGERPAVPSRTVGKFRMKLVGV